MIAINKLTAIAGLICAVTAQNASLPVVDLGYQLQQATTYNATGKYFTFSDIRYAAPPLGELRFAKPQSPAVNRTSIQQGGTNIICPQANPAWEAIAADWIPAYLLANRTNYTEALFEDIPTPTVTPQVAGASEDCLFLDVVVPQDIFQAANKAYGAPVLVWIYGGGYVEGSKTGSGNPAGLLTRSESNNGGGVIYVAMNYRLGAFGWLSGPTFQENGTANAGLYDQRFALEWIQKYIHLFGGDPNRVTVFGESAGGGSIMHQITAFGGYNGPAPFSQAVIQSPGFEPIVSTIEQENTFNTFLSYANVTTLEQARNLSSEALILANSLQVLNSSYGGFVYGPAVDGDFTPALPGQLLARGQYDKNLRVMLGHNADEGLLFTDPLVQNNSALAVLLASFSPDIIAFPKQIDYIENVLYPQIFDGSQAMNYTNEIARTAAIVSEFVFVCNTFYLDKAFKNNSYAYLFAIPPALHGYDIPYTYYNGNGSDTGNVTGSEVIAPAIAIALQEYITHFAETGSPNEAGVPYFPMYGNNATIQVLNIDGITEAVDPAANYRCDWWQKGLYI